MRYTREGWPASNSRMDGDEKEESGEEGEVTQRLFNIDAFKKIASSLSDGCLLYRPIVVIPHTLQSQILEILHIGYFGMQRMKQLARTVFYWPGIDADIVDEYRQCTFCAEHQKKPAKYPVHTWMLPEKPWSRLHIHQAIQFMRNN